MSTTPCTGLDTSANFYEILSMSLEECSTQYVPEEESSSCDLMQSKSFYTRARQRGCTVVSKHNILSGGSNCTSTTMRGFRVFRCSFQATRGRASYSRFLSQ